MKRHLVCLVALVAALFALPPSLSQAEPCWIAPEVHEVETEEQRTYRWGWFAFAKSCEPGVAVGWQMLDPNETIALVERVAEPTLTAPLTVICDATTPERVVGASISGDVIAFRNH